MVDETGLDEPKVDETAVDEIAVDEPGPHRYDSRIYLHVQQIAKVLQHASGTVENHN